ncbi:MAG TPA: DUF4261 domain-containing protein [Prosthecobacter sp.]
MKGFFTQGGILLLEHPIELSELEPLLAPLGEVRQVGDGTGHWAMGGDSLVVSLGLENNAAAAIDVVPHPWPDSMGDPKTDGMVFASWSMGHFGPLAWPGGLERAMGQAWTWPEARSIASSHTAFIRVKVSYVFGGGPDTPVIPEDYCSSDELYQVTYLLQLLAQHPAVIAWFNPNGELLLPPAEVTETMEWSQENEVFPMSAWTNVRMLKLDGIADGWMLMDTVGMGQLEEADLEAFFPMDKFDPSEVAAFLRNASNYIVSQSPVINDNDTMDGPGGIHWQARSHEESFHVPPRRTLRWFPFGGVPPTVLTQEKSPLQ